MVPSTRPILPPPRRRRMRATRRGIFDIDAHVKTIGDGVIKPYLESGVRSAFASTLLSGSLDEGNGYSTSDSDSENLYLDKTSKQSAPNSSKPLYLNNFQNAVKRVFPHMGSDLEQLYFSDDTGFALWQVLMRLEGSMEDSKRIANLIWRSMHKRLELDRRDVTTSMASTVETSEPAIELSEYEALAATDRNHILLEAAANGRVHQLERLLKSGADIGYCLGDGMTALHLAAGGGHNDAVELLIRHGADVNARSPFSGDIRASGSLPMHLAARGGYVEIVQFLLRHKADSSGLFGFSDRIRERGLGSFRAGLQSRDGQGVDILQPPRADSRATEYTPDSPLEYQNRGSGTRSETIPWPSKTEQMLARYMIAITRILRPVVSRGHERIEWRCSCGKLMFGDFHSRNRDNLAHHKKMLEATGGGNEASIQ